MPLLSTALTSPSPAPSPPHPADDVFKFASTFYATSEASYPYTAVTGTCKSWATSVASAPAGSIAATPSPGFKWVAASADAIMSAVSSTGPVAIYFNVQGAFWSYTSGIYPAATDCSTGWVNHGMVVVGYNKTAGLGTPGSYWIVRNSW
jgi:hypothetical protein